MPRALCVAVNDYPGTEADLSGCINDAQDWGEFFGGRGYEVSKLLDKQATKRHIVAGMSAVLHSLKPGETGVICYSGHGTWVPDLDGDEPDGRDEALVPYDAVGNEANLLIDDEIAPILADRPAGTRVLFITDSCHSGTVFRFSGRRSVRFLPPEHVLTKAKKRKQAEWLAENGQAIRPAPRRALPGVIHFAACRDTEYAADASFGGRPNGAFSYFLLQVLRRGKGKTYAEIFAALQKKLPSRDYPQRPQLNATAADRKRIF